MDVGCFFFFWGGVGGILYEILWETFYLSHPMRRPGSLVDNDPAGARQAYRLVSGEFLPGSGLQNFTNGLVFWGSDVECHG